MRKVRDYLKFVNEIINLQIPFRVEVIGSVVYSNVAYPMLAIKHVQKMANYNMVINAGAHGEEAVAVRVLTKFLSEIDRSYLNHFNFYIFPCTNPYGYAYDCRRNGSKQIVNNADKFMKDSEVQELGILYNQIPTHPDLFIDVHADTGKKGIYIYERKPESFDSIAKKVLQEANTIIPYEASSTIYKEKVEEGVIIKPENDRSLDDFMGSIGVEYTLTVEIPGKAAGQVQLTGGVAVLNGILKEYLQLMETKKLGVKNEVSR